MINVILIGANGQLGRCVADRKPENWNLVTLDSGQLDITNSDSVKHWVSAVRPKIIINASAYTAVDKAESDADRAYAVNVLGPENLAILSRKYGSRLVHISTDYVFEGNSTRPYVETDLTGPQGVYGRTKLEGEKRVLSADPACIVIRTSWVFSEYGNNFVKTMIMLAQKRNELFIVDDQKGCPTYAGDLAHAIISGLEKCIPGGIYHFCGDKPVVWKEFAEAIFSEAVQLGMIVKSPSVTGIRTENYPTPARRPAFSVLDCSKIMSYGIDIPDWKNALNSVLKRIQYE